MITEYCTNSHHIMDILFGIICHHCKRKLISVLHIIIIVFSICNSLAYSQHTKDNICTTKRCYKAAKHLKDSMNPMIDPCQDFYEFTCGNFLQKTIIPEDEAYVGMFSTTQTKSLLKLKTLFEQQIERDEPHYSVLVKNYYQACMDEKRIESRQYATIQKVLSQVIGGWPVVYKSYWNSKYFNWQLATHRCAKLGCIQTAFINILIDIDYKNSTRHLISLGPARPGLSIEYLVHSDKKEIVNAYFAFMVHTAILLGAEKRTAQKELREVLLFEKKLARISLTSSNNRNATLFHNLLTLNEMQAKYPSIKWLEFFNGILQPTEQIRDDEVVVIKSLKYIKRFEKLISNTSKRTLANYIGWRIVLGLIPFSTKAMRQELHKMRRISNGITKEHERWRECVPLLLLSLDVAVNAMYVQNYFNKESKIEILQMVANLREQLITTIKQLDWMDEQTKRNALDKALAMSHIIAYPDELLNNQLIEEYYADLQINKNNFLESYLNTSIFHSRYRKSLLHKPVEKYDWKAFVASEVNANYNPVKNMIHIPAGVLQGVFFDKDRPNYMNFGAIGYIIGHELIHGFDDRGQQYDKNGNLLSWWKAETKNKFLKKAQCIIEQYGNYTIPEINRHLNGVTSQGENIADNGGIKQSYYAYKKWIQNHGPEPKLPGLPYTPEQMFWISAGSIWCTKRRPQDLEMFIILEEHLPEKYRVLGTLSNQKEFANDFQCPVGSAMNPRKKCEVW